MQYCLVIRIGGLEQLNEVMGTLATDMAVNRLAARLPAAIASVLEHHSITLLSRQTDLQSGLCYSCFEYQPDSGLLNDPDLIRQTLLAAETRLLAVAVDVFGYATAKLANLQIILTRQTQALDPHTLASAFEARYQHACTLEAQAEQQLLELLAGDGPRVFLQPIVDIRQQPAQVIGHEALARGPGGSDIERADQLFETARRCGLLEALEKACLHAAVPWLDTLPASLILSVNSSATLLLDPSIQQLLARSRLWVELTEHLPLGTAQQLGPVLNDLTQHGALIALDDTGCGYADLQAAHAIRPGVVKLCITVIRALEQSDAVLYELRDTVQQLHALGCLVLAEGVETAAQLALVRQLGVDYAQGWYFGRPEPAESLPDNPSPPAG